VAADHCRQNEQLIREVAALSDQISVEVLNPLVDRDRAAAYGIEEVPATVGGVRLVTYTPWTAQPPKGGVSAAARPTPHLPAIAHLLSSGRHHTLLASWVKKGMTECRQYTE